RDVFAGPIFENEGETAGRSYALNRGWRKDKSDSARNLGNLAGKIRFDSCITFLLLCSLAPFLKADPHCGAVSIARKAQQIEPGHRRARLDARCGQCQVLDLLADCHRALERSGERELNADVKKALVLLGQKPRGEFLSKDAGRNRYKAEEQQTEGGFVDQNSGEPDISRGESIITTIEPLEKLLERP